jgi:predicted small lipoprotein YifL
MVLAVYGQAPCASDTPGRRRRCEADDAAQLPSVAPGRPGLVGVLLLAVLALGAGCGIKGPPRPPLDALAPAPAEVPDGGCCKER